MGSIFDWLDKNSSVADALFGSVLPSAAAALLTKQPGTISPDEIARLYSMMAQGAVDANAFAKQQQAFYQQNYYPMAQAIAERAQGIGHGQDLANTMAQTKGNVDSAYAKMMSEAEHQQRRMGVDPTSSGAIASRNEIGKGYTTDLLTSMNNAKTQREAYGDQARAGALQAVNTKPDFATPSYLMSGAANGMAGFNANQNALYQQQLGDTAYGLSDPWNRYQQSKRQSQQDAYLKQQMDWMGAMYSKMMGN